MKNISIQFKHPCRIFSAVAIILALPVLPLTAQDYWDEVAQLPTPKFLMSAEKVGNLIYVMGGITSSAVSNTQVLVFNPADNSFQARKPLPKPLAAMATAVVGDTIYVFGGIPYSSGPPTKKCYKYVPATDTWYELPDMPTLARGYAVAEVLNNRIYVIGGASVSADTTYGLVEAFDPQTNSWVTEAMAQMPTPRAYMGSTIFNNRIYVFGGTEGAPSFDGLSTVESFDGKNWITEIYMPTRRYGPRAGVIGNTVYVSGGVLIGWTDVNVNEGYSNVSGWQTFTPLPVDMHAHAVVEFGDLLYAFGGVAGPLVYDDVLVYHTHPSDTYSPLKNNGLSVFPSPANDRVIFRFENIVSGQMTFWGPNGTLVFTEYVQGEQEHAFSVAGLPAGVYSWRWAGEGERVVSGKVMVVP